jgi:hypothetical protein
MKEKGYDPQKVFYVASFLVADKERKNQALIDSNFSQIAYTHSHMFDLRKIELALKSSNLDREATFAIPSSWFAKD